MKGCLLTSVNEHRVKHFYPVDDDKDLLACRIIRIVDDMAEVRVTHSGNEQIDDGPVKQYPLTKLLLVSQYSSVNGEKKKEHSSKIPKLLPTPTKPKNTKASKSRPIRSSIPAIVIGPFNIVANKAKELSPNDAQPITLVITHQEKRGLTIPTVTMDELSSNFKSQGSMDMGNQGRSCGVEAVINAGFAGVTADDFNKVAAEGIDPDPFICSPQGLATDDVEANDAFVNNSGGGNNIPPNQMFATLQVVAAPLEIDQNMHFHDISSSDFWKNRNWAILAIPACGGHYVAMRKVIIYDQEAICLFEGRGNVVYDFINEPLFGAPVRLAGKRKR